MPIGTGRNAVLFVMLAGIAFFLLAALGVSTTWAMVHDGAGSTKARLSKACGDRGWALAYGWRHGNTCVAPNGDPKELPEGVI